MKDTAALLLELKQLGVTIHRDDRELVLRGATDRLTQDLTEKLKASKPQILATLAWQEIANDIAGRWNQVFAGPEEPIWLPPAKDQGLQARIGERIRAGDLDGLLVVAEEWRREWEKILTYASRRGSNSYGYTHEDFL